MKVHYKFAGINDEARGLRVYVDVVVGDQHRLKSVLVPWEELTRVNTLHQIDQAVRKRLQAAWEGEDEMEQRLPGID